MVRYPAERERRAGGRERDKCRRNRERREEGEECVEREGGLGGIPPHSPLFMGFPDRARACREERKRWMVEERRGLEGRGGAGVAFVCFPRFKASLEK